MLVLMYYVAYYPNYPGAQITPVYYISSTFPSEVCTVRYGRIDRIGLWRESEGEISHDAKIQLRDMEIGLGTLFLTVVEVHVDANETLRFTQF